MKKKILFLCTGNSCRSQMAEGYARTYLGSVYEVYSAGIEKHGMNPRAVRVMAEDGVDLSTHFSKNIDELPQVTFDLVITVCDSAKEHCPYLPAIRVIHHGFEDPPALTRFMNDEEEILKVYRRVRNEIKSMIFNWNVL